eukprot:scaffold1.g5559.t1
MNLRTCTDKSLSSAKAAFRAGASPAAAAPQRRIASAPAARRSLAARAAAAATAEPSKPAAKASTPPSTQKPTVVITGASSGLGLNGAAALAQRGDWHVILACRDSARRSWRRSAWENYSVMHLDLASFESVRQFVNNLHAAGRRVDALVCNAAIYLPTGEKRYNPQFTADGFELTMQTNHLGHFLLVHLLLDDLKAAVGRADIPGGNARVIIVGSITGNDNTLAGNVPPKADLGDLRGLAAGVGGRSMAAIDGKEFDGAKAYKDSKICNMLTMQAKPRSAGPPPPQELHRRLHSETGIAFTSLYPGCIAETGLFRNHLTEFKILFPVFQKYVTKGYVSEEDAGKRLAQAVSDPTLSKSGVYWSWDNDKASLWFSDEQGRTGFENTLSEKASDAAKALKLYDISLKVCGLAA